MRKDSANNKSCYSEREPPNLDSKSRRFTLERVFGEGCPRKKFRLDRSRGSFSRSSPLRFTSLEKFGFLFILMSISTDGDDAVEFERAASEVVL
jgi:hypothetical protein